MTSDPRPSAAPAGRRAPGVLRNAYAVLISPKLAIALLILVLACCLAGVTIWRYQEARSVIFSALWFNALLVLLALSSGAAFFSRIWRRKLTVLSVGMIVFHLSFAAVLGGIVYNSLFRFRGMLRLTEGETLPNAEPASYDLIERGRFFDFARLRGETTLVKVHRKYEVEGQNKRTAYEIEVGEGDRKVSDTIYVARGLEHDGVRYICWHEGYSILVVVSDPAGNEIYGGYLPLQSLRQPDGKYLYASGKRTGAAPFHFPPPPDEPLLAMTVFFRPSTVADREGEVTFQARPVSSDLAQGADRQGRVIIGGKWDAGGLVLSPREVRYWVTMDVRHEPGLNLILGSLCSGLAGMVLILIGRIRQGARKAKPSGRVIAMAGGHSEEVA